MRADRLLSLLLLLQTRGRMTARELAERLEVSERTIYRDVSALSVAGVPIYSERGPGGGCALMDGYRTSLTGLTEAEARTLVISGAQKPLADLGLGGAVEAALLKLQAALPAPQRDDAERARQRVYLDPAGWGEPDSTPHLKTIEAGVWSDRRVRMSYRKVNGQLGEYAVDPLGLVAKASVWYLVGGVEGELRTFRVSRVRAAALTEEPCRRPDGFDLAAYWAESSAQFRASWAQYPVTLRASPQLVALLPNHFGEGVQALVERAGRPDAEGWVTLTLTFEGYDAALARVASFGALAEVLAPEELRAGIVALARELAAFYVGSGGAAREGDTVRAAADGGSGTHDDGTGGA